MNKLKQIGILLTLVTTMSCSNSRGCFIDRYTSWKNEKHDLIMDESLKGQEKKSERIFTKKKNIQINDTIKSYFYIWERTKEIGGYMEIMKIKNKNQIDSIKEYFNIENITKLESFFYKNREKGWISIYKNKEELFEKTRFKDIDEIPFGYYKILKEYWNLGKFLKDNDPFKQKEIIESFH